ncbi:MAG: hypothetical protein ACTH6N_01585 [Brachybacterium tyrofermentans]|uniref:hypothetical protein n=1 Tax=Brachybacterium tyrofermentans TaxID=47848 RepID=UPI000A1A9679|nr:hypothetical protein [Brachybacterium tyrofermentans]SLM96227.1 hypothetical protein FM103_01835 [Corynebacterium xerosis]
MSHEPTSSLVASERRTFSALALMGAAVVALLLVAVTGTILLESPSMDLLPGSTTQDAAIDALVILILHV